MNDYQALYEEFERKRKSRLITVSFDDEEVRQNLREINQPITLFGEGPADRRERLRNLLVKLGKDSIKRKRDEDEEKPKEEHDKETWYHPGPAALEEARYMIADYSIRKAKERLERARNNELIPEANRTASSQELYKRLAALDNSVSILTDSRLTACIFSPDSSKILTCSWSGELQLWSSDKMSQLKKFTGHTDKVCSVVFNPKYSSSSNSSSSSGFDIASSSFDGTVHLWKTDVERPIATLEGHKPSRVYKVRYHPSGDFIGTASADKSWRLWDLRLGDKIEEVLFQEGHTKDVTDIAFHPDGSLAGSTSEDTFARAWDLRTGRCVMLMDGHTETLLSIDFSPNGYYVATGSSDHSVKIWDLRQRKCEYTIPAHNNLVSRVVFEKNNGSFLLTSSYDKTIKMWTYPNWAPIQALNAHTGPITYVDINKENDKLLSCSFDRTIKTWTA